MDFAHALDCAHEVGVLADWGKDWYEARTVLRLENPEVVWRVPEKPISEIIIRRKAYYPVLKGWESRLAPDLSTRSPRR